MRLRHTFTIGLLLSTLAFSLPPASAEDTQRRPRLRKQVMLLRAELAALATQVNFGNRNAGDQPTYGPGSMCGDPCTTDSDEDGLGDCEDPCPCDANLSDDDADGVPDCYDPCPGDAVQACIDPCNMDSDGDGTKDCEDACPWDPAASADEDGDNIPDCQDYCPNDRENLCFEPCKIDRDGDGVGDCDDTCPWVGGMEPGTTKECVPPQIGN